MNGHTQPDRFSAGLPDGRIVGMAYATAVAAVAIEIVLIEQPLHRVFCRGADELRYREVAVDAASSCESMVGYRSGIYALVKQARMVSPGSYGLAQGQLCRVALGGASIDAAIVTTGFLSEDMSLIKLLRADDDGEVLDAVVARRERGEEGRSRVLYGIYTLDLKRASIHQAASLEGIFF